MKASNTKVLVTCPPMLGMIESFSEIFVAKGVELTTPEVIQALSVNELKVLVPQHDGWIIGDDPANREVLEAGRRGRLKAAVKWGIGVDNVDRDAIKDLGIRFANTPQMFGREVADIAISYVIALARETFLVDRAVRQGNWHKPRGISLAGRNIAVIGFGDIGRNIARRALASEMKVFAYDPAFRIDEDIPNIESLVWPERLGDMDFLVFACALNDANRHMLNAETLTIVKHGVRIVNVSRGPLIDETALANAQSLGDVHSVALDVFETEPLPSDSPLRSFERNIFGTHNGSNTEDAVERASQRAIEVLFAYLDVN